MFRLAESAVVVNIPLYDAKTTQLADVRLVESSLRTSHLGSGTSVSRAELHRGDRIGGAIVVRDATVRRALEVDLFALGRTRPIVVAAARDGRALVALDNLAETVQSELVCYFVPGIGVLRKLNRALGKALAVWPASLRIFWPEPRLGCDPNAHPLVPVLHNEPEAEVLHAFGYAFDLSRPRVRRAHELLRDGDALLSRQLNELRAELSALEGQNGRHMPERRRLPRNMHSVTRRRAQRPGEKHE